MSDEATSEDWVRATAKMVGFDAEVADAAVARLGAAAHPVEPAPDQYSLEEIAAKIADRVPHADADGFSLSERLRIGKAVAPLFLDLLGTRTQPANGG